MKELRTHREALGLSQSRLARLSNVSRFKICVFELGDGKLTAGEMERIRTALQREMERLTNLRSSLDLAGIIAPGSPNAGVAA